MSTVSGPALISAPAHSVPSSSQPRFGASSAHVAALPSSVRKRPEANADTAMVSGTAATISAYAPTRSSPTTRKTAAATTRSSPSSAIIAL